MNIAAGNTRPISPVHGLARVRSIIGTREASDPAQAGGTNQFVYNLSTMLGTRHFIRAGTDIRAQKLDDLADNNSRGSWAFTTSCGGTTYPTPYAAFLDGCVTTLRSPTAPSSWRTATSTTLRQDDWQILPN